MNITFSGESSEHKKILNNICPDCGGTLKDGACGGLSINKWCLICGHGFNDMFLFGSERIPAIYI
jgi:hypothetical protein